jgi:hypothetical protein
MQGDISMNPIHSDHHNETSHVSNIPAHLQLFSKQAMKVMSQAMDAYQVGDMSFQKVLEFNELIADAKERVINHPIIRNNLYLARFEQGVTKEQAAHEVQQFSVFARQFNVAQAQLAAESETVEAYNERTNILRNEIGCPYAEGFEGELSGKYLPGADHQMWLKRTAEGLGLGFADLGRKKIAQAGAKAFATATFNYYAHEEPNLAAGAAFAIENWAANYLWKPWIAGMNKLNETLPENEKIHLGYMTYHDKEEEHHSQATLDELLDNFTQPWFNKEKFLEGAERMLNEGIRPYYEHQLATLPQKDATWSKVACE